MNLLTIFLSLLVILAVFVQTNAEPEPRGLFKGASRSMFKNLGAHYWKGAKYIRKIKKGGKKAGSSLKKGVKKAAKNEDVQDAVLGMVDDAVTGAEYDYTKYDPDYDYTDEDMEEQDKDALSDVENAGYELYYTVNQLKG